VIALAKKGVVVTEFQAKSLADYRTTFIETNGPNSLFSKEYKVGDTIKYPALAHTLQRVSDNGRDSTGRNSPKLINFLKNKAEI
jgi:gamma-glutamyltranspeptidase/glutathione hydrolase